MTPTAAASLIDEVGKLWPKRVADGKDPHPWSEATQDVYHETLCSDSLNLTAESGLAVVRQLKREGRFIPNDAGWRLLLDRLRETAAKNNPTKPHDSQVTPEQLEGREGACSYTEYAEAYRAEIIACYEGRCRCEKAKMPYGRFDPAPEISVSCAACGGSLTGKHWYESMDREADKLGNRPTAQYAGNLNMLNTIRRIVGRRELGRGS